MQNHKYVEVDNGSKAAKIGVFLLPALYVATHTSISIKNITHFCKYIIVCIHTHSLGVRGKDFIGHYKHKLRYNTP